MRCSPPIDVLPSREREDVSTGERSGEEGYLVVPVEKALVLPDNR